MHKKFEVNWTKINGGCQSYTKAAPQQSWSDLTLEQLIAKVSIKMFNYFITINEKTHGTNVCHENN